VNSGTQHSLVVVSAAVLAWLGSNVAGAEQSGLEEVAARQRIRELRAELRDVPLPWIIEEWSGHRVLAWAGEHRAELTAVAAEVVAAVNRDDVVAARANEAGNAVENYVIAALAAHGFRAGRPAGPSGRMHAAGYPDVEAVAENDGEAFYVEVKTFSAATGDSAQRTFYLSPSADFKVTRDAHHLLIAIELEHDSSGHFRALGAKWLDLSRLRCDLKPEFNASNRDLYRSEAGLTVIEVPAPGVSPPP
jgi:hypothetical protein